MLDMILPHASTIIIGEFEGIQDTPFHSVDAMMIKTYIESKNDTIAISLSTPETFLADHLVSYDQNDIIVCT